MNALPSSRSALFAVLSQRHFLFLWLGQIFSQFALNSLLFVLALFIYQKTGSNAAVSGLFLSYGVPAVLFGMVAGAIVDKLDRRTTLVVCDVVRASLAIILFFYASLVGVVYLVVFLSAIINQFYVPSEAPLIPRFVPKALVVSANSLFSFTYFSSMGLGFILAGPLIQKLGAHGSFTVIGALFLVAALAVSRIPGPRLGIGSLARRVLSYQPGYLATRTLALLGEGLMYVRGSPVLVDALLLLTGTQIILALLGTLGPGFADRVLEIDVHSVSWIIVAPTVAGIISGALWVGNRGYRLGTKTLIQTGIFAAGLLLVLIALTVKISHVAPQLLPRKTLFGVELILFFLLGVANAMLDVPANSILQTHAAGPMRGRIYGMLAAAIGGVGILPVVIGGVLADVIGVGKVIFLLGMSIASYGVYRIRYNKKGP